MGGNFVEDMIVISSDDDEEDPSLVVSVNFM